MDLYELQITLTTDDDRYYVDHRLATYPGIETTAALLAEARDAFRLFFDAEAQYRSVSLVRLAQDEPVPERITAPTIS